MLDEVTARIEAAVPELAGRIDGAAGYDRVMRSGSMPAGNLAAYLLPMGIQGRDSEVMTGVYRQVYAETLGLVLLMGSTDRTGEKALENLRPMVLDIINAMCGWAPGDELGVFELRRGSITGARPGRMAYQLEFSIVDQLRIST